MKKEITTYDIMEKELNKNKHLIFNIFKIYLYTLKTKLIDKEKNSKLLYLIGIQEYFNSVDIISNIYYELFLDLTRFKEIIIKNNLMMYNLIPISVSLSFRKNYFIPLLFNAVFENNGECFFEQIITHMKTHNEKIEEALKYVIENIKPERKKYLRLIKKENFEIKDIDDEVKILLDEYHKKFMNSKLNLNIAEKKQNLEEEIESAIKLVKKIPDNLYFNIDFTIEPEDQLKEEINKIKKILQ